ncbi:MAG: 3-hydroxyacyl-CoA dehydrogenase NAD-binding domain-containing protein [Nitrospirota bacterium]
MYIYKVGVIGAGAMGAGIAQVITYAGIPVILKDVTQQQVDRGLKAIRGIYQGRVDRGKMTASEMEQKMALVTGATDYSGFSDVDLVIEAIFEDISVKQKLFCELESVCSENTLLTSNTSSLPISAIAAATKRPEKVIGFHFFNPAPAMKLVEIIPGLATSRETIDDLVMFSESIRKIPIRVTECAGFLVNRLLMPYLNESAIALQEGVASAKEIDEAMVAFGMPMGPFALLDTIGIDVSVKVAEILYDAYGSRMKPAKILSALYQAGRLGVKSGAGFYGPYGESADGGVVGVSGLSEIIAAIGDKKASASSSGIPSRLVMTMVNEAVIALQEGVASASDIDIAMMAGTGFPQDKGGPLHYADQIGIDTVYATLKQLASDQGERFWPAPMLKRMMGANYLGKKSGKGFFNY